MNMRTSAAWAALALCAAAMPARAAEESWVVEARGVSTAVPPKLLAVLQAEIAKSGPEGAIAACQVQAPALARAASEQTGWSVKRVSLRNRNPKAVPDAWERAALEDFDRRAAAHEPAAKLERYEAVQEDGKTVWRYMRALPTGELCLACHGPVEQLSPAVKAKLAALYPEDRATSYRVGDIRGAMTLKKQAP
ncbi:MAG: DUF3365 domain-containing protein [Rhizobacter sp.]|nr:DUF3365 domain-containing protein [Rhizobacter sp.]